MNVLDKLSILSAMLNCNTYENCIARGRCQQIRKRDYIIEIIHDVRELLKEESHDD